MRRFNKKKKPKHQSKPRYAKTWSNWGAIYTGSRYCRRASFVEWWYDTYWYCTCAYHKEKGQPISKEREKKRTKRKEKERYSNKRE